MAGEEFSGARASVGETGIENTHSPFIFSMGRCPVVQKKLEQFFLHARVFRMNAGRYVGQRSCASAVHMGCGVDFGAGV